MADGCPICPPGTCKGYPHLWKRLRESPERWRRVHDQINAQPGSPRVPFVLPPAIVRGWKKCLYSSWTATGCCGGAVTCHWKRDVIPLSTCVACLDEMG